MRAPRLFVCRDKNTQGCQPGRLRIFIGQKPTMNERGEWCNYSATPEDFKVAIPREMFPEIKDGGYMTYEASTRPTASTRSDIRQKVNILKPEDKEVPGRKITKEYWADGEYHYEYKTFHK